MSRATAEFYTPNGKLIGYGTYQGSSDLLQIDYAHDTPEEPWEYEKWDVMTRPCDKHEIEQHGCVVYSDYGGGFWWPSTYCPNCKQIKSFCPWDGLPRGWPADGHPFKHEGESR